jgi:hypothetical protein
VTVKGRKVCRPERGYNGPSKMVVLVRVLTVMGRERE